MKRNTQYAIRNAIVLALVSWLLVTLIGCDAFVRKFTRKPKKENFPQEEMVLVPEEYTGPQMSKENLYRQYLFFWKSWQDELIESLLQRRSHEKQVDCAKEAIKNLIDLRALLNENKQKKLDIYVSQLKELQNQIAKDLYGSDILVNLRKAERIKRSILRELSYDKVSPD